jgi:hypothetical protein
MDDMHNWIPMVQQHFIAWQYWDSVADGNQMGRPSGFWPRLQWLCQKSLSFTIIPSQAYLGANRLSPPSPVSPSKLGFIPSKPPCPLHCLALA